MTHSLAVTQRQSNLYTWHCHKSRAFLVSGPVLPALNQPGCLIPFNRGKFLITMNWVVNLFFVLFGLFKENNLPVRALVLVGLVPILWILSQNENFSVGRLPEEINNNFL